MLIREAREGAEGKLTIVTSTFACVEVLKLKEHEHLSQDDEQMISDFFQYPFIKFVDATRAICEAARHLIWKHSGLKPKDAVHMASALAWVKREPLDVLFSYDSDFLDLDGTLTGKFHIKEPFIEQLPLFKEPESPGNFYRRAKPDLVQIFDEHPGIGTRFNSE